MSQGRRGGRSGEERPPGWAEHTVVANLPRLLPGARINPTPLSEVAEPFTLVGLGQPPAAEQQPELVAVPLALVEEPRTVVGLGRPRASAQQLLARYAAQAGAPSADASNEQIRLPLRENWLQRVASFARDDFRRAPRIVRLLVPALPLLAAATTFLDVDPAAPALSRAVAVAATSAGQPAPTPAATAALPAGQSVTIARRPGHTLASDAADAAARGDRARAIAIYAQLAREQPNEPAYASAARILLRDEARNRPRSGP
jgi:hypothetical protein